MTSKLKFFRSDNFWLKFVTISDVIFLIKLNIPYLLSQLSQNYILADMAIIKSNLYLSLSLETYGRYLLYDYLNEIGEFLMI